jgi:enoyl-CoA hydratase/carnithine racemase
MTARTDDGGERGGRGELRRAGAVTVSELGSARVVTWDRQANRNAWTRETIEGIADAIDAAGADEAVRCVIARGAGEHFSAGDDLFAAIEATPESWAATVAAFQRVTNAALAAPIPVLAAIDGVCIGGALEFAASCDLRIATDRARFGTPEVGIGLTYTNAGSHFLPSTMGETAARELLLTGALRDVAWARRHRFVNEVVPAAELDARVAAWAAEFDGVSRAAVARTKAMLNARFGELLPAAMEREERACVELFDGPDAPSLLHAFAQRRR